MPLYDRDPPPAEGNPGRSRRRLGRAPWGEQPTVHLDGSTGIVYHELEQHKLFKIGKARSGEFATQYKLMLASLDPLGLTLAVDVVVGNRAENPLYVPCCQRVKEVFMESGLLVVGDRKMKFSAP